MKERCPCCSGLLYEECCRPYHNGKESPTSLALMRSRYSAYAKGLVDYIQKTTHPKSPHYIPDRKKWSAAILEFTRLSTFVRLEILGYGEDWVEFAAHLIQGGKPLVLREKSRFEQVQGRWCYLSGDVQLA